MKVLIDIDVLLDTAMARPQFLRDSANVLDRLARPGMHPCLCGSSVTTLYYVLSREIGQPQARQAVRQFLTWLDPIPSLRATLQAAVASDMADFEDAVVAYTAQQAGASAIVTRNLRDFAASPVRAYTPEQWLALHPA